ncbi:MAG: aldehyde ferredoxin oxidoreductase, partial [Desulfovibrio sp.]
MTSCYGWTGKYARIDATDQSVQVLETPEPLRLDYLGGRGMAGALLRPHTTLAYDHPDMPLLVFTGPLTATVAPTSGRSVIMSRSPLTGAVGDSSVGGKLGTRLKRAGWDGLMITGKAHGLCGIEIDDNTITFVDAKELAGSTTHKVLAHVSKRLGTKATVLSIGPAAESGVRFAGLGVDSHHAAGRVGLGLSFAAKNIKYIAIQGSGKIAVHDLAMIKAAREDIFRLTAASPVLMGEFGFTCAGTGTLYDLMDSRAMMPTDNFQRTRFEHAATLNAHAFAKRYKPRRHGCLGCHILCKKIAEDGRSMPEFETMSHFTALIGSHDQELVVAANDLCNKLGMDTISAASALACHAEVTQTKLTPEAVLSLLRDMASGHGAGQELAQGATEYARSQGRPQAAMAVKGLDLPAYDPRGAYGMALAYSVATRGGCHLRAYPVSHEILRKPVATDRFSFSGKARIIKIAEDVNAVIDSLIACKFVFFAASLEEYARALTGATGMETTAHDLLRAGERIVLNERAINAENGFSAKHDDLPPRFFQESGSGDATLHIPPLDRSAFLSARHNYYQVRGCDSHGI